MTAPGGAPPAATGDAPGPAPGPLERRARRLLRWYPAGWRMRYGEEFAELLLAELSEQPRAWRRTVNVAHCGITARLAAAGLAGPPAGAAGARASLGAAVYFCCLEALQNTAKYAHATQIRICLRAQNGTLGFTVSDDGAGYDARRTPLGSGLRNMADRLAALGGRLEVQSAPGQGTAITGHLPVPAASDGR